MIPGLYNLCHTEEPGHRYNEQVVEFVVRDETRIICKREEVGAFPILPSCYYFKQLAYTNL